MTTSFTEFSLKVKVKVKLLSPVPLFVTPGTVAYQAPLSMEFSRQEYWSGLDSKLTAHFHMKTCIYVIYVLYESYFMSKYRVYANWD